MADVCDMNDGNMDDRVMLCALCFAHSSAFSISGSVLGAASQLGCCARCVVGLRFMWAR